MNTLSVLFYYGHQYDHAHCKLHNNTPISAPKSVGLLPS